QVGRGSIKRNAAPIDGSGSEAHRTGRTQRVDLGHQVDRTLARRLQAEGQALAKERPTHFHESA
ncbi:MAG: hypothetical protein RR505_12755, partial [Raoultibacter sp.]